MKLFAIWVCFFIVFMAMFSSCTGPIKLIFFNNTGHVVNLKTEDDKVALQHGYNVKFNATVENGQKVEFSFPVSQKISISTETTNWLYQAIIHPPREYCKPVGTFDSAAIRIQLEATGEIYLLKSSGEFPLKNFNNQPEGYPLRPVTQ